MSGLLDKVGVNDKFIATKIKEGAEATKFVQIGEENYSREPDFYARHKYLDTALKIKGHLIAEVSPNDHNHFHLHLESNREDTGERIRDFTNQLSQNNRG